MPTEKEIGGWVFSNNDHIIKMARSAGMHYSGACTLTGMESHLERFAALVAAHEREACAKVCEDTDFDSDADFYRPDFAAAIRARGEQEPRQWVSLSDHELELLEVKHAPPVHPDVKEDDWWEFARAIEAKLREKNSAD